MTYHYSFLTFHYPVTKFCFEEGSNFLKVSVTFLLYPINKGSTDIPYFLTLDYLEKTHATKSIVVSCYGFCRAFNGASFSNKSRHLSNIYVEIYAIQKVYEHFGTPVGGS